MKKNKICKYCGKEILGRYTMFSFDVPYCNLFVHKDCEEKMRNFIESATEDDIIKLINGGVVNES